LSTEDEKRLDLIYERIPYCPFCKSDMGYELSGWMDSYIQCKNCEAKWLLVDWLSDEPKMKLVEVSRVPERDAVVGDDLLGDVNSLHFWKTMKVKKIKIKEPEIPEAKEVTEQEAIAMSIPSALWWLAILIPFPSGLIAYASIHDDNKEMARWILLFNTIIWTIIYWILFF
jgi:hypothetical protein